MFREFLERKETIERVIPLYRGIAGSFSKRGGTQSFTNDIVAAVEHALNVYWKHPSVGEPTLIIANVPRKIAAENLVKSNYKGNYGIEVYDIDVEQFRTNTIPILNERGLINKDIQMRVAHNRDQVIRLAAVAKILTHRRQYVSLEGVEIING